MILRDENRMRFTICANTLFRSAVSLSAKGLFRYMMSMSDDWCFYQAEMAKRGPDGLWTIKAATRELEAAGYIIKVLNRMKGRFGECRIHVFEHLSIANQATLEAEPTKSVHRLDRTTRGSVGFCTSSDEVFADKGLPLAAKGLMACLLSKPDDYTVTFENTVYEIGIGKTICRRLFRQLIAAGYMAKETLRGDDGRLSTVTYTVFESCSLPRVVLRPTVKQHVVDRPLTTTENTIKTDSNQQGEGCGKTDDNTDSVADKELRSVSRQVIEQEFESLRAAYPPVRVPQDTAPARDCYVRRRRQQLDGKDAMPPIGELLEAVEYLRHTEQWMRSGGRFIKTLVNFIRHSGWEDTGSLGRIELDDSPVDFHREYDMDIRRLVSQADNTPTSTIHEICQPPTPRNTAWNRLNDYLYRNRNPLLNRNPAHVLSSWPYYDFF